MFNIFLYFISLLYHLLLSLLYYLNLWFDMFSKNSWTIYKFLNYLVIMYFQLVFKKNQCRSTVTCLSMSVFFRFIYRILFELYCISSCRLSAGTKLVGFLDGNILRVFMLGRRAELLLELIPLEVSSYVGWLVESPCEEIKSHLWQVMNKYRRRFVNYYE